MARTLTQLFPPMPGVRKLRRPLIIWTTAALFGLFAIFLLALLKRERVASGQYEEVQVVADDAPVHTESFSGLPASYAEIWEKSQSAAPIPQEEQRPQAYVEPRVHGQPTAVIGPSLQNSNVADKTLEDQEREKALRSAIFFTAIAAKAVDAVPGAVPATETALPDLAMPRQAFDVLGDVLKTTQRGESSETRTNQKAKQDFLKAKAEEQAAVYRVLSVSLHEMT